MDIDFWSCLQTFSSPCDLTNEMILVHNNFCVREDYGKLHIGKPHITDKELDFQPFLSCNVSPVISQMALSAAWKYLNNLVIQIVGSEPTVRVKTCLREKVCRSRDII